MVTVEMLESQIATLGEVEFKRLAVWFHEFEKRVEEPRCAISGMTATESVEISRALAESIRMRDYSNASFVKA